MVVPLYTNSYEEVHLGNISISYFGLVIVWYITLCNDHDEHTYRWTEEHIQNLIYYILGCYEPYFVSPQKVLKKHILGIWVSVVDWWSLATKGALCALGTKKKKLCYTPKNGTYQKNCTNKIILYKNIFWECRLVLRQWSLLQNWGSLIPHIGCFWVLV